MAKVCMKCSRTIPWEVVIDGVAHGLSARKYCLECSPFGERNTKQLHVSRADKCCKICGRNKLPKYGRICDSCLYKRHWKRRVEQIYGIVGTACWICNYDKGMAGTPVLDFHHMNPEDKEFRISRREAANFKWSRVWLEMQKCALLCCRCHRECHVGLIPSSIINDVYVTRWENILKEERACK